MRQGHIRSVSMLRRVHFAMLNNAGRGSLVMQNASIELT